MGFEFNAASTDTTSTCLDAKIVTKDIILIINRIARRDEGVTIIIFVVVVVPVVVGSVVPRDEGLIAAKNIVIALRESTSTNVLMLSESVDWW